MKLKSLSVLVSILLIFPCVATAQEDAHTVLSHGSVIRTVAFSPTNPFLVASAGDSGEIKLWNLQTETARVLGRHDDTVHSLAFSPNGTTLLSGGDDFVFRLWRISTNREIAERQHRNNRQISQVKAVAFSPDGDRFATGGRHAKVWNTRTYNEITTLEHEGYVWGVAFSNDGTLLATGERGGYVNVWDLQNEQVVARFHADSLIIYAVAFSPNDRYLAGAGYDGTVHLWTTETWQPHGTLDGNGTIRTIDFSPDGSTLTATGHESIQLWRVDVGHQVASLPGATNWVNSVDFSSDSSTIIAGGDDGNLRLWDVTPYNTADRDRVRLVYFVPRGRNVQPDIAEKLETHLLDVQRFYAEQMASHGFGGKTFTIDTDENGNIPLHEVRGQFRDQYYHTETWDKIQAEIESRFDMERHLYLIVADISTELIGDVCGVGGGGYAHGAENRTRTGGFALVPASGDCFEGDFGSTVIAHELGHAFGLQHDFRDDSYLMSYGADRTQLSHCATGWLDASRFFNAEQTGFNEPATIQLFTPLTYAPNVRNFRLQFQVTDVDSIHQAQLLLTTTEGPASGSFELHSCRDLNTQSSVLEFSTPTLTANPSNEIALQVIDVHGNITERAYTLRVDSNLLAGNRTDVNGDGAVDVSDLVLVATHFGRRIPANTVPNPDVNHDGVVRIDDLILVASLINVDAAAPALHTEGPATLTAAQIENWIHQAEHHTPIGQGTVPLQTDVVQRAVHVLTQLRDAVRLPTETALLPNYPNPFNPETWLPYQLATASAVTLRIHTADGNTVRTFALGHRPAGTYHSKTEAVYWDGRNRQGEPVASGVYFYTLSAGDFTETRRLLIKK